MNVSPITRAAAPNHTTPKHVAIVMDGNGRWPPTKGA